VEERREAGMPVGTPVSNDETPSRADGRLRVSDAERQSVVDALSLHTGDGRLAIDEFEERSERAFAARTRDDLRGLLDDLPSPSGLDGPALAWAGAGPAGEPVAHSVAEARPSPVGRGHAPGRDPRRGRPHAAWYRHAWADFFYLSLLLTGIWVMSGAGYFWPMWVIVPVGLGTLFCGGHGGRDRIDPTPPGTS
jgi:hypothetical protein